MTYKQVIDFFGSQTAAADYFGISVAAVSMWREGVPELRQRELELYSHGKLKADKKPKKDQTAA